MLRESIRNILFVLFIAPLALRAEWLYRKMPTLRRSFCKESLPSLSIIVPARNEEQNLQRLLPTLCQLDYPGSVELIVVNDHSEDDTAVIAKSYGAKVINIAALPEGWKGKPHAAHHGALAAKGELLLFTDADTAHTPDSAKSAVAHVLQNNLDGLSLYLKQETQGILDKLVLMVAFAGLYAGLTEKNSTLNGQYVLLRRDVYEQTGGFAMVRDQMLEDLAYGRLLKKSGYNVPLMHGEKFAAVYMYQSVRHLWYGMTRLSSGSLRFSGVGALMTALFITWAMLPFMALLMAIFKGANRKWVTWLWLSSIPGFIPWSRRFNATWLVLFAPFGALFIQFAGCWGFISKIFGKGIRWKNRFV